MLKILLFFILLFFAGQCCKLIINEVISNVYRFESDHKNDFVELRAVDCDAAPSLEPYILLMVQIDYEPENAPLIVQFASLATKTLKSGGRFTSSFTRYYSIGIIPEKNSFTFQTTHRTAFYNWLYKQDYYNENAFTATYEHDKIIEASKNFAIILINTGNSDLPAETVQNFVKRLQYITFNTEEEKGKIILNDQNLMDFIMNTIVDCMILIGDEEKLKENNFGKDLSIKYGKPMLNYDVRAQKVLSINVCGDQLVEASITPNEENDCNGKIIYTKQSDCVFKSLLNNNDPTSIVIPDFAKISTICSDTIKSFSDLIYEKGNRYGTTNLADFLFSKGAGKFYDFDNIETISTISKLFVCEKHLIELRHEWDNPKKITPRSYCTVGEYFETHRHQTNVKADRFINRKQSFLILTNLNVLIPVGTPICRSHSQLIDALMEKTTSSSSTTTTTTTTTPVPLTPRKRGGDYCNMEEQCNSKQRLTLRHQKSEVCLNEIQQEKLEQCFYDIDFKPLKMERSWRKLGQRAQQQHVQMFRTFIKAVADMKSNAEERSSIKQYCFTEMKNVVVEKKLECTIQQCIEFTKHVQLKKE